MNGHVTAMDDEQEHTRRRRWPLVTGILVVLVAVVVGGGFVAWSYTQRQYYVGEDAGRVVIYRGINQKVAGISLSHVYRRTGIPVAQVTTDDLEQVRGTITASSLADASRIVDRIRLAAQRCQQAFAAQQRYQQAESTYRQQLRAYQAKKGKRGRAPTAPVQPASPPPNCPPPSGHPAGSTAGSSPGSTTSASPGSTGTGSAR